MGKHIPKPLTSGHLCPDCNGTGANIARTLKLKSWETGYVMCWTCNGNGLDPAAYFNWRK
jgi:DnaJ-class molecular chaperone